MNPAIIAAILQAAGAIGGGLLGKGKIKETKSQKLSRKTAEDLLNSMRGSGPYADLFKMDEEAFNKSYVDPAKAMFRNQIAPQIQQSYIAGGQQRGTGLDDQLLRAGVDLDQMLNSEYMNFQNQGKDRMSNAIGQILGLGAGAPQGMSTGDALKQSAAGYLTSDNFGDLLGKIIEATNGGQTQGIGGATPGPQQQYNSKQFNAPRGFAPDYQNWAQGNASWGY